MKQKTLIALGMVVGLGLALSVMAAEKPLVVQGTIAAIDATAKTVTVKTEKEQLSFKLASNVALVDAGKPIALGELKVGDHVKVDYLTAGGSHSATRVERVHAMPAKAPQHQTSTKPSSPPSK